MSSEGTSLGEAARAVAVLCGQRALHLWRSWSACRSPMACASTVLLQYTPRDGPPRPSRHHSKSGAASLIKSLPDTAAMAALAGACVVLPAAQTVRIQQQRHSSSSSRPSATLLCSSFARGSSSGSATAAFRSSNSGSSTRRANARGESGCDERFPKKTAGNHVFH